MGLLALLPACGSDKDNGSAADAAVDAAVESAAAGACDHFEFGPPIAYTAADAMGTPPTIQPHTRSDVTLVDVTGGKGGRLQMTLDEELPAALIVDTDVPLKVSAADGTVEQPTSTENPVPASECAAAKAAYVFNLPPATYTIELGPTDATSVKLVLHVVHPGGDDDDDDEMGADAGMVMVPAEYANLTNPVAGDPAAAQAGAQTYAMDCAVCHGDHGGGDGPDAHNHHPAPVAFTEPGRLASRTDGYLFWRITTGGATGSPPSEMPAFGSLSEDARWQLVTFLRTLAP
jgi:mono/diheme cytochrome c family protein